MRYPIARQMRVLAMLAAFATAALVAGCEVNVQARSGSLTDDYVEEPLIGSARKYAGALYTSNTMLNLISSGDIQGLYERHTSDTFKARTSYQQLAGMLGGVQHQVGGITSFKTQQWDFATAVVEGTPVVVSTKIVEHGKLRLRYLFVFERNTNYQQVLGLNVKEYRPPQS